ncbi:AAA family ATPase [Microbacterium sp.]|uniref:AAA family ATPase n=1 Tax=Microbacterium sp. TaxID=51671 RepID=UPI0028125814|nr:AAA family ATPase [Microbacterium sp.]
MSTEAVFINGTSGVGKSSTLQALSAALKRKGTPHAVVDFDYLRLAWPAPPDDPYNLQLGLANLANLADNARQAGAEKLAVAYVVTRPEDVAAFAAALGVPTMHVIRLRAEPEVVEARLRRRHEIDAPWELAGFLEGMQELQHRLDAVALDDLVIDVTDRSPAEVAQEILVAAGW